jgi:hypothetical protein
MGRVMRFLLRMAFWLGVVLVVLPSAGSQPAPELAVSAGDAVSAAKAAVGDMRQFCERQTDACAIGSHAASALGRRAQAGAKMLYEFLNEQIGPNETGSLKGSAKSSQSTLTPADLTPVWRGPQPRRDPQDPSS